MKIQINHRLWQSGEGRDSLMAARTLISDRPGEKKGAA
jgi:hypothetical protein